MNVVFRVAASTSWGVIILATTAIGKFRKGKRCKGGLGNYLLQSTSNNYKYLFKENLNVS